MIDQSICAAAGGFRCCDFRGVQLDQSAYPWRSVTSSNYDQYLPEQTLAHRRCSAGELFIVAVARSQKEQLERLVREYLDAADHEENSHSCRSAIVAEGRFNAGQAFVTGGVHAR
jgi:hypothetical protein